MALINFLNKSVLVTGHTGFKGSWLTAWLKKLGANVVGISLDPPTVPSHFAAMNLADGMVDLRIDIRSNTAIEKAISLAQPDFIFHLAAQSLVRRSYENPLDTWQTNVIGTLNILEALRKLDKPCSVVIVTSDKCYRNNEWVWGYRENDQLGGADPYSASKGAAELAIYSHIQSYFPSAKSPVRIASARAGNVIGGGDWASDRIIPDCIKAWSAGMKVELRNPNSTRPWQHVLEPLSGYLNLAIALVKHADLHGEAFNFGPSFLNNYTVLDLVRQMGIYWDKVQWDEAPTSLQEKYESGLLKLNCDKAMLNLNWHTVMSFEETVCMTVEWYRSYYQKSNNSVSVTNSQIADYSDLAKQRGLFWAQ